VARRFYDVDISSNAVTFLDNLNSTTSMNSASKTLVSVGDIFKFLEDCVSAGENHLFRGVRKKSYALTCSVGRHKTKDGAALDVRAEKIMLNLFKQKAHEFIKDHDGDDLALLSIAQHHGLPTRLLDWSKNPLVALFFAVKDDFLASEEQEDSKVFVYVPKSKIELNANFDPFAVKEVKRYAPRYWHPRISAQLGVFTVHNDPNSEWVSSDVTEWYIAHAARRDIKLALNKMGFNSGSLFPDLGGISEQIKWLRTNAF
jgi:tRNA G37 N-methylase Trm5